MLYKLWFEHFVAVLKAGEIRFSHFDHFMGRNLIWYECPCGQDHLAARFYYQDGYSQTLSPVLI
jgi:hypothetical protein